MVDVYSINAGYFRLDGGAMFGVVPRVLWERHCAPDDRNRIRMACRSLLVVDGDRKILVDTGFGNWHDEKFIDQFALENPEFDFNDALGAYGLCREDITDVVVSHLHFDHAGGLAIKESGVIGPAFRNASIWLQRTQWQWAQNPAPKDRASFMDTYLDVIRDCGNVRLLDGAGQISENVSVLPFDGHSPGMQTVIVESGGETCWFPADLIPTVWHLRIPYLMAYDNNPILAAEEKTEMLSKIRRENWIIRFYHDADHEMAGEELIREITGE